MYHDKLITILSSVWIETFFLNFIIYFKEYNFIHLFLCTYWSGYSINHIYIFVSFHSLFCLSVRMYWNTLRLPL